VHNLNPAGTTKRFDYAYNSVNDITAVQRDNRRPSGGKVVWVDDPNSLTLPSF